MKGGIYSSEKCSICGCGMKDNGRNAVCCPDHPEQTAHEVRVRIWHKKTITQKKFRADYHGAARFLTGVRFQIDQGTFDARDFMRDNPLGFSNLARQWIAIKEEKLRKKSFRVRRNHMQKAMDAWGDRNIKTLGYAEIEDLLYRHKSTKHLASKTRHDMKSVLHDFWVWLRKRRTLTANDIPEFPEVEFTMAYRKIVDHHTQYAIVEEVKRITERKPRIWYAIQLLATYPSIRPGELIQLKEKDVMPEAGFLIVRPEVAKDKKLRMIELVEEDIELLKSIPRSFGEMPFFRHERSCGKTRPGDPFSENYLGEWWNKACKNLGIEGVSLYPGTKHSTVVRLGEQFSPEEIQGSMKVKSNAAFSRYFRVAAEKNKAIYAAAKVKPEEKVSKLKKKSNS
jgi:integrase